MRISAVLDGDEPEVATEEVAAQHLQPWMLYVDAEADEVYVVVGDPVGVLTAGDRPERWVDVPLFDADPLSEPATARMRVAFGERLDVLQELLPEDLYSTEEEALARNGLCPERVVDDPAGPDGDEEEPVWCGRRSDPGSFYRLCEPHDQARKEDSSVVVARGFNPTYGAIAPVA